MRAWRVAGWTLTGCGRLWRLGGGWPAGAGGGCDLLAAAGGAYLAGADPSWTAPLGAVRSAPGDDAATVTAQHMRQVVTRLIEAEHWKPGDPEIMLVADLKD